MYIRVFFLLCFGLRYYDAWCSTCINKNVYTYNEEKAERKKTCMNVTYNISENCCLQTPKTFSVTSATRDLSFRSNATAVL